MAAPVVHIEPSLWPKSPQNGNIRGRGRRLSAVEAPKLANWEPGDEVGFAKSRYFGSFSRFLGIAAERRNAWLTWQDSNSYIPGLQAPFEISREFRTISLKSRAGDFRNYLSAYGNTGDPIAACECDEWTTPAAIKSGHEVAQTEVEKRPALVRVNFKSQHSRTERQRQ